ncbi:MAG: hypothetical protein L6R41_006212, partial [Letrouitia leprolyta]
MQPRSTTSSTAPQSSQQQQQQPPTNSAPQTITLILKSLRSPPLSLSLPSLPATTSIFTLKQKVSAEIGRSSTEGIKILYSRKPCGDARTVGEVVGEEGLRKGEVEMGVMVMGGGGGVEEKKSGTEAEGEKKEKEEGDVVMGGTEGEGVRVAQGKSGAEVLEDDEFWDDLRGWLMQRVRDEGVVGE